MRLLLQDCIPTVSRGTARLVWRENTVLENPAVPVFYSAQNIQTEKPMLVIDRERARNWRDQGKGYFVDHGKALRLLPHAEEELERLRSQQQAVDSPVGQRDESCFMGEKVMNANVQGQFWARAMVRSWNPKIASLQHAQSLKKYHNLERAGA
jgi:hypothetical protein